MQLTNNELNFISFLRTLRPCDHWSIAVNLHCDGPNYSALSDDVSKHFYSFFCEGEGIPPEVMIDYQV